MTVDEFAGIKGVVPRGARLSPRRAETKPATQESGRLGPRYAWAEGYEVGDGLIDDQHRMLLDFATLLYDAVHQGKGPAVVKNAFDALRLYTGTHFRDEEAYLEEIACRSLESHREEHRAMVAELEALEAKAPADGAQSLVRWVETHLVTHMKEEDQAACRAQDR